MSVTVRRGLLWVPVILIFSAPLWGFAQQSGTVERVEIDARTMEKVTTGVGKHVQAFRDSAKGLAQALQPVFSAAGIREGTSLQVRLSGSGDVILVESLPSSSTDQPISAELRLKMGIGDKVAGFELKANRQKDIRK